MTNEQTYPAYEDSRLPHVGTYRRSLGVSLERMYENALDWEHLPHVHAGSFAGIECIDAGTWGWRAKLLSHDGGESIVELALDRDCGRWITRTLSGAALGSEVWTQVQVRTSTLLDVVVDFFVPGIEPQFRAQVGELYSGLYRQLYDEDEAMMVERQIQLERRIRSTEQLDVKLPPANQLQLPHRFEFAGRQCVLREHEGELIAHGAICPHQLAPLRDAVIDGGELVCPWHGYRFDLHNGECTSGALCRLSPVLEVRSEAAEIVVVARGDTSTAG